MSGLTISSRDACTVAWSDDEGLAIKVQDHAAPPRWLKFDMHGRARKAHLDCLIGALERLRDADD